MALQTTATGASILTELAHARCTVCEAGQRLAAAILVRVRGVFDPYRPELHYMRGPGPKWRAKHGVAVRNRGGRRSADA